MSNLPRKVPERGAIQPAHKVQEVQEVSVAYNEKTESVTVTPGSVHKGANVRFKDPKGGKLKITFLSPEGHETDTMSDSDACAMTIGGSYHFKCFFNSGAANEVIPETGGVIEVLPRKP